MHDPARPVGRQTSTIEDVTANGANASEAPAWRDVASVKKQGARDGAFPMTFHRNLCHRKRGTIRRIGGRDAGHAATPYERKLSGLSDNGTDRPREAAGFHAVDDHMGHCELAVERFTLRFEIDRTGKAIEISINRTRHGLGGNRCSERSIARTFRRGTAHNGGGIVGNDGGLVRLSS